MSAAEHDVREAALRYYATVDGEDAAAVAALFAPDATYERPGYALMTGRAEILSFYARDRVIARGCHVIDQLVCDGPRVAVEGSFTGELRDGSGVEVRFSDFFVFADGLIARRRTYFAARAV